MIKLALCMIAAASLSGIASAAWVEPKPVLPTDFTIGLQAAAEIDAHDYALAAQAGFNLVLPARPGEEYNKALLAAAEAAGIGAVAWDPRMSTYDLGDGAIRMQAAAAYRGAKALRGYIMFDTIYLPPAWLFSTPWRVRDFMHADSRIFCYCEATPPGDFQSSAACRQYFRRFLASSIGFAAYEEGAPFSAAALGNMKAVSEICQADGKPWWRRCRLADTSPAMIRWQAYSAAAAGARGVIYLAARPLGESRPDSLLDAGGKPSAAYEAAKQTNARLAAIGPILMASRSVALCRVGSVPGELSTIAGSLVESVTSDAEDDGFLVGLLADGDTRYALVVRKPSAADKPALVSVKLGEGKATVVETGQPLDGPLSLLPGEGQLLRIR